MVEPDHQVAMIGAGLGGIGAAIALKREGIDDFVVLERASDIGGTWRDNTYPGIAVDIPAQAYQFSFELKPGWSRVFASGAEVKAYIDQCTDRYAVRPHVRLDSEVLVREWDEDAHLWRLKLPGGSELTARFVISAVGAFVNPKPAEIPGVEDFEGPTDPENYRRNPVRGRDGFDLASFYASHRARSYESVSMPGLPNHFMNFGPYGWTGGTWHVLVETASHHIIRVLKEAGRRGATAVEVREEAADRWTRFATERLGRSLWSLGSCATANSYYFDHHGDTPFLRPTSSSQAWQAARTFPLDDYSYGTLGDEPGASSESGTVMAGSLR